MSNGSPTEAERRELALYYEDEDTRDESPWDNRAARDEHFSPLVRYGRSIESIATNLLHKSHSHRILGGIVAAAMAETQLEIYWRIAPRLQHFGHLIAEARGYFEADRPRIAGAFFTMRDQLFEVYIGRRDRVAIAAASNLEAPQSHIDRQAFREFITSRENYARVIGRGNRSQVAAGTAAERCIEAIEACMEVARTAFVDRWKSLRSVRGRVVEISDYRLMRSREYDFSSGRALVIGAYGGRYSAKEQRDQLSWLGWMWAQSPELSYEVVELRPSRPGELWYPNTEPRARVLDVARIAADRIAGEGFPRTFRTLAALIGELVI